MKRRIAMEFKLAVILLTIVVKNVYCQTSETANPTDYEEELPPSTHVPKFVSQPTTFTAREGETISMSCDVDEIGTFSTVWQKDSLVLFADRIRLTHNAHYVRQEDRSLLIKKIRSVDAGKYTCIISSNPQAELYHTLVVLIPPKIHLKPKNDLAIQKDHPFHLNCEAHGIPPPTITWKKLEGLLPNGKSVIEGHNVTVSHAERTHSGTYECLAANGVGDPIASSVKVQVLYKPEIEVDSRVIYSGEGISSELSCTIHADPAAGVIWKKGGTQLRNADTHKMKHSGNRHILQIRRVSSDDFGMYTCEARNTLGMSKDTMEVTGLASPVVFKSNPNGVHPDTFMLKWSTNSYSKVIEYSLKLREKKEEEDESETEIPWTEIHIPAESQPGLVQTENYEVTGLNQATMYEAIMTVHNTFGWNKLSEQFLFSTEGKAQPHPQQATDEDENQDNSSSVPAPTHVGIISLLTVVILSVFF